MELVNDANVSGTPGGFAEPDTNGTNDKLQDWKRALDQIAHLYAEVERRSFTLPGFSLMPMGVYSWAALKFTLLLELDLFLLVPMNCVIAVRNIFPGRWAYRSFSGKYFRAIFRWIRNGETPLPASIAVRSLTAALLSWHFHERLTNLRRRVIIEEGLDPSERALLIADLDRLLIQWPAPKLVQGFFAYCLPLLSPLAALYQMFVPSPPGVWTHVIVILSLSYALGLIASAFVVKRGLMLGGEGRAAYFPGFLEGNGAYSVERKVLAKFGLREKEFPLAYSLTLLLIPVQLCQNLYMYDSGLYRTLDGGVVLSKTALLTQSMAGGLVLGLFGMIALVRQRRLGRL